MIVKIVFLALLAVSAFLSPALSLLMGIVMALVLGNPFPVFSKKASKKALQVSVVGLGFGMNLFAQNFLKGLKGKACKLRNRP